MGGLKDRYIRFDWAIKRLLRQKANFDVLEGFLTVFIGEEVKIVEILESEGNQQTPDDKFNRVDIKARNSKGEIILVEVQNTSELYYLERILYGVAKAITEHIHLGDTYKEVKKVYSISILYFDIGKGADYLYVGQNKFIGVHTNDQLVITAKEKGALVQKSPQRYSRVHSCACQRVRQGSSDSVGGVGCLLEEWSNKGKHHCSWIAGGTQKTSVLLDDRCRALCL